MKKKQNNSHYPRGFLIFILVFMVAATWGIGLSADWFVDAKTRYLTVIMLTVAECMAVFHALKITDGTGGRKNMPLRVGGTVILILYLLAVALLAVMALRGVPFLWLMVGHAVSMVGLLTGLTVVAFAVTHAKKQDKRDKERLAPFAEIRNRFGALCYQLEQSPGMDGEVLTKAIHIRDEVLKFARSNSDPSMEAVDNDVAAKMTDLESILARMLGTDGKASASAKISQALENFQRAVQRREMA